MALKLRHPFHLVDNSPWPLFRSFFALSLTVGIVNISYTGRVAALFLALAGLFLVRGQWWRDVSREATLLGDHSLVVELGIRWGIILFIISEVFFFVSFFWAFFYSRLAPNLELGSSWPPMGISSFDPVGVPLLNRVVLLSSGVSVTWAHHRILSINHSAAVSRLALTIGLGLYFTSLQGLEYWEAPFSFRDGAYGSVFFIATGFHGLHVLVGSLFLLARLIRLNSGSFSHRHHTGLEVAAWYWHFVDVVWLFLYLWVYVWAAN
jgi:cytochrome c oxidase subunit 3